MQVQCGLPYHAYSRSGHPVALEHVHHCTCSKYNDCMHEMKQSSLLNQLFYLLEKKPEVLRSPKALDFCRFLSPLVLLTILPYIQNTPLFAVIRFVVVILFYFCWVNVISREIRLFASGYGKFLFSCSPDYSHLFFIVFNSISKKN